MRKKKNKGMREMGRRKNGRQWRQGKGNREIEKGPRGRGKRVKIFYF